MKNIKTKKTAKKKKRMIYKIRREKLPLAVLALDQECFPYRPLDQERSRALENSLWWIVWQGREPVGYAGLSLAAQNKGLGFFSRAGVLPRHRGRGLQKRLIRVRETEARALGIPEIVTYVVDHRNSPSINSLVSCGYRFYRPSAKWAGKTPVYLRKKL